MAYGSSRSRASTTTGSSAPRATASCGSSGSPPCPSPRRPTRTSPPRSPARRPATCCRGRCATCRTGLIAGSTRYHDIVAAADRVEIGYTWYARRWQRSHVNTACKLLLLGHAFDTLGCKVVGLRTDNFNFASQKAIEALGAKKDGVIRHHAPRRDGTRARHRDVQHPRRPSGRDVKRHLEVAARAAR